MINLKETIAFLKQTMKPNMTLVIGVSGGADSMCLLDLVNKLKQEKNLKLIVAHVNHGIRKESDEEAEFVREYCQKIECTFSYKKLNFTTKTNFEANARDERYKFFKKLIKQYQAEYLLTAHHGDDLMETILMRLTRGSTLEGYSGFGKITQFENYKLVRPLIYTAKEEIETYNKENNIEYRIDKTNIDEHYTRNRYRKCILPFLKQENKNVHKKYLKFSEELKEINAYLQKQTDIALTRCFDFDKVNLHELKVLDIVLQKRVIMSFLKQEYKKDSPLLNEQHLEQILKICITNKGNAYLCLPLKKVLIKEYNYLYFKRSSKKEKQEYILEDSVTWSETEKIVKVENETTNSNYIFRLNTKEVALPLRVRTRKSKDKMQIKNLNGTKKIKDIFINEKVPKEKRDIYPIVVDANDTILWLPGLKKTNFDKKNKETCDIIYKYVISEEKQNEEK